jgi:hypothetical protein
MTNDEVIKHFSGLKDYISLFLRKTTKIERPFEEDEQSEAYKEDKEDEDELMEEVEEKKQIVGPVVDFNALVEKK